ncbi:hypothetical protein PISMIDRAFT_105552, partial [Pisolithus microcarpus 441]
IYRHPLFCINHTTYDLHRETDSINPQTAHQDITLLADGDGSGKHLFCYAHVLGIYHVNVTYISPRTRDYQSQRQDILWVCWFELLPDQHSARFVPMDQANAFGFVDPMDMLWCCHLIPSFADGRSHPDSIGRSCNAHDSKDWKVYYINQ